MSVGRNGPGPAALTLVLAAACGGVVGNGASRPMAGPSSSPSPSYLGDNETWSPPTYREGGVTVMPVTFPDGTTAELVYPPDLPLEELNVYPDTYALGGPRDCGLPVYATRHDLQGSWVAGDEPLDEHVRTDGMTVELWKGTSDHRPYEFLLYRFGDWTAVVPCLEIVDRDHLQIWAENLHGEQSEDGLLILRGTPPIVVNPWRNQHAATIRMSDRDIIVDLRTSTESCDDGRGGDRDAEDGVIQWCIQPHGGIYLYANGFSPAAERFLADLVEGLGVRRVRPQG